MGVRHNLQDRTEASVAHILQGNKGRVDHFFGTRRTLWWKDYLRWVLKDE